MTIELVSSRIVAPLIGSSVYSWTAVIGVTLLGLALGSYLGGILADRIASPRLLPFSFGLAAIFSFIIPILAGSSAWLIASSTSLMTLSLLLSLYLFLVPAVVIGLIQPIVVKKYVSDMKNLGKNYGFLSMIWSLGSILGVFLTGFYFISNLGSRETVNLIAFILIISGFISALMTKERKTIIYTAIITVVLLGLSLLIIPHRLRNTVVYAKETSYYNLKVVDFNIPPYGDSRALLLDFDTHSVESRVGASSTSYTEIYPLFKYIKPNIQDILVIGAGAYTLPKNFKKYYEGASVSVIEIDPEIPRVAASYFNFDPKTITTEVGDARVILQKSTKKYDVIFGDAYNSFISVPGSLLTEEFNEGIKNSLTKDGIYAVNFISSIEGKNSEMFKSLYATFTSVFPNTIVLHWSSGLSSVQNITLVGSLSSSPLIPESLSKQVATIPALKGKILLHTEEYVDPTALVLTDNFYPTEKLMKSVIEEYYPVFRTFLNRIL